MPGTDSADWTNTVTVYEQGGTPVSAFGAVEATNFQSWDLNSTGTFTIGPNDITAHTLVFADIWVSCLGGTITGLVVAQVSILANYAPTTTLLSAQSFINGIPASGEIPYGHATASWPGGAAIPGRLLSSPPQMEAIFNVNGFAGGTITGAIPQAFVALAWA